MTDTYDRETSSKRQKRRSLVKKRIEGKDVTIDEDDYLAYQDIESSNCGLVNPASGRLVLASYYVQVDEKDEEKRIHSLLVTRHGDLPEEIYRLLALKTLRCQIGSMRTISSSIGLLKQLESLRLIDVGLAILPDEIGNLVNLKELYLIDNPINRLPHSIGNLKKLKYVTFSGTRIQRLPPEFWDLSELRIFDSMNNGFSTIPSSIERLQKLTHLSLMVGDLPKEIGNTRDTVRPSALE